MKLILQKLNRPVSIAPLITFRVVFGVVMLVSVVRFMLKGWVYEQYIKPQFFFSYFGFEWIRPLPPAAMYTVFVLMALAALGIMLGLYYRWSAIAFFLLFTYIELIDKTNYLNHYYFVSLVSFLLIWVPAGRYFSLDVWRKPIMVLEEVPAWMIGLFKLQLGIVYFYAGLAKLNPDWLLEALPLKIWLPVHTDLPVIGTLMQYAWVAYAFSWFGALYDLSVPFLLLYRTTRTWAYAAVVIFHITTWWLFPIGMFPFIMIGLTLIFFTASFHKRLINGFKQLIGYMRRKQSMPAVCSEMVCEDTDHEEGHRVVINRQSPVLFLRRREKDSTIAQKIPYIRILPYFVVLFFVWQILFPWRFLLYPGELFWTEQGYRFSWRVMLMEKAGYVTFHVKDPATGGESEVSASEYLTPNQEKTMATQPDMILQFAHFIRDQYQQQGIRQPVVQAEAYVTLNGQGSRLFLNPEVNLADIQDSWQHKTWILEHQ